MKRFSVPNWVYGSAIVLLSGILTSDVSAAFKYLAEGMPAPPFKGPDLMTDEERSSEEFIGVEGRMLVVAFWASWSERSFTLLGDLADFARDERYDRLDIIGVNVESARLSGAERKRIAEVVEELDLPFPMILDEDLAAFSDFGVVAVPSTAVLDDQGTLMYGPGGYSHTIRDRIVDSVETWLGLRDPSEFSSRAIYVPTDEASRQYNLARQLMLRGMNERSLPHLEQAIAADPGFAAAWVLKGEALFALEQLPEAVEAFERATALDNSLVSGWTGLGVACIASGNDVTANEAFAHAYELDSAYTPALVGLARLKLRADDPDAALTLLSSAYELAPSDPELNYLLGEVRERQDRVAEALRAYETALQQLYPVDWNPQGSRR